jgi:hypothetical protein
MIISNRVFVTYEDRLELLDGLRLLCLSFARYSPTENLHVFLPQSVDGFSNWVERHGLHNIQIMTLDSRLKGWNIKSEILLNTLSKDQINEAIWIDADILLTCCPSHLLEGLDQKTLLIASNKGISDDQRALFWQFEVCRRFEFNLNTCFLRVTQAHQSLLLDWFQLSGRSEYQQIQDMPMADRPAHLFSDQDLLEGLLMSNHYAQTAVKLVEVNHEVLHVSTAYSIRDRLSVDRRIKKNNKPPALIHAHGLKPWMLIYRQANSLNLSDVVIELSPYIYFAKSYRACLESDTSWMDKRTWVGHVSASLCLGNPHLQAIPVLALMFIHEKVHKYLKP